MSNLWGLEANRFLRDAWIRASVPLSMLAVASSSAMMTASFKIALQSLPSLDAAKCHHAWAPATEPGQLNLAGLRHWVGYRAMTMCCTPTLPTVPFHWEIASILMFNALLPSDASPGR